MDPFSKPPRRRLLSGLLLAHQRPVPPMPPPQRRLYRFRAATEDLKLAVWRRGEEIPQQDPRFIRRDSMGGIMLYSKHGDCSSEFGWEIDHIIPVAAQGSNELNNLQPLQWRNNRLKGDIVPVHRPRWAEFFLNRYKQNPS